MICDLCDRQSDVVRAYRPHGRTVLLCMDCVDRIIGQFLAIRGTEGSA